MADKIIQVAALDQATLAVAGSWTTFPSPSGELTIEQSEADNTIFGIGAFESSLPTITSHSVSMSAFLRETAGYNASLKKGGTPTAMTGEAMELVSGKEYKVTDSTKDFFNPRATFVVYDGASEVSEDDYDIDHLFGRVTFVDSYTVGGSVTVDGEYVSTTAFGNANTIDLTQTAGTNDTTTFESAQADNGYTQMEASLLTVDAELSGFHNTSSTFFTDLNDRNEVLVEIDWTGTGEFLSRGVFRNVSINGSGDVGSVEEVSVSMTISAIEGVVPYSFRFDASAGSEVSAAFKLVANAWLNREVVGYRYAPAGMDVSGDKYWEGKAVITDTSISNSVDGIAELTVELQGTKELVENTVA